MRGLTTKAPAAKHAAKEANRDALGMKEVVVEAISCEPLSTL